MLEVRNLTSGYGKLTVLHDFNLRVNEGEFTAILGPNGSGKSTLLKSIFGLAQVFKGQLVFEGQPIMALRSEQLRSLGIAYVPQRSNVFASMTVRENLLLAIRHLSQSAAQPSLEETYELFPILTHRQGQRAGLLSGGERQMLAIALGWLAKPRLLLLDEPSAGLSPQFVTVVFRTLDSLRDAGITLVVVEQNARSLLCWCTYAYLLREGEVAFEGTASQLLEDEETVKSYLGVG